MGVGVKVVVALGAGVGVGVDVGVGVGVAEGVGLGRAVKVLVSVGVLLAVAVDWAVAVGMAGADWFSVAVAGATDAGISPPGAPLPRSSQMAPITRPTASRKRTARSNHRLRSQVGRCKPVTLLC